MMTTTTDSGNEERAIAQRQQDMNTLRSRLDIVWQSLDGLPEGPVKKQAEQAVIAVWDDHVQMHNLVTQSDEALQEASQVLESTRHTLNRLEQQRDSLIDEIKYLQDESHESFMEGKSAGMDAVINGICNTLGLSWAHASDLLHLIDGEDDSERLTDTQVAALIAAFRSVQQ